MKIRFSSGTPCPLGATVLADGINFAVFSRNATAVYLELFHDATDASPWSSVQLDPERNRTGDVWHIFAHRLRHGQLYGFRVDGPYAPLDGHRFNVNKLLSDPYARAVSGRYDLTHDAPYGYQRRAALADLSFSTLDSAAHTVKSVAIASSPIDWEDDRKPRRALRDTVIYECHLKGFTAHPSSAVSSPGTYLGIIDKIPHLQRLGITAVELLPLQEFNEREPIGIDPVSGKTLHNFWGYNTLGFFCPEMTYSHRGEPDSAVHEFQEMVKQFHRAGIEVLLDVVFNHTGEGHQLGPTLGFRGFDNSIYYLLDNGRYYANYSGCGNTVNCNHPVVKQFILDCLRFWVVEMHVDGFRFDLATILGRSDSGDWIGDLSLLNDIVGDPILRGGKLIAESWDAAGMYKVGGFPTGWAEWNGRFRDDIRRFSRGDAGLAVDFARRLGGSFDLFSSKADPAPSINFVTCHDGFTLRDLVSYRQKHNMRNGENNRDGADENFSSNLGVEGDASDPTVHRDRIRRAKNMMTALMLARGTPMLLAGDELWRSQGGNNNTYCQDNETGWLDWTPTPEGEEMERFLRMLVWLRRRHPALRRSSFVDPLGKQSSNRRDITWHGVKLYQPDWAHNSHSLALQIHGEPLNGDLPDDDFYLAFNNWSEALLFELPRAPWRRLVDTHAYSPADIFEEGEAPLVGKRSYLVHAFSALVLHSPSAARVRPTPRR